MKCTSCGSEMPSGAAFCAVCGARMAAGPSKPASGPGAKTPMRWGRLVAGLAVVALGVVVFLLPEDFWDRFGGEPNSEASRLNWTETKITREGGTLQLQGIAVKAGAGVLPEGAVLRATPVDSKTADSRKDGTVQFAGPTFRVEVLGFSFLPKPVQLTLPFDPQVVKSQEDTRELGAAYWTGRQWQLVPGQVDWESKTVTVEVQEFSEWRAAKSGLSILGTQATVKTREGHFDINYVSGAAGPSGSLLATPPDDANYQARSTWPANYQGKLPQYDPKHPKYVQDLGVFLEESLSRLQRMGFAVPGNFRGTVYVQDLATKEGQTSPWFGTLYFDNDMKHSSDKNVTRLLMRAAAHELFHALQINAGWRKMPRWFMEASAVYVEQRVWESELGNSTIQDYLKDAPRFPNQPLDTNEEAHYYAAAAFLIHLQDSYGRGGSNVSQYYYNVPKPPDDVVAEMYALGGRNIDDWRGTTDTDYLGYLATTVLRNRGYTMGNKYNSLDMFTLWREFTEAYFADWAKWGKPKAWFETNAGLLDQNSDWLDLSRGVEKSFKTEWEPLTGRLFEVDGDRFLKSGGAEAERGATVVVTLESLAPSGGNPRFEPYFQVFARDLNGQVAAARDLDLKNNILSFSLGPLKNPSANTKSVIDIVGAKGPTGWLTGTSLHNTVLYAYMLLPPAAGDFQLTPDKDKPGQQSLVLGWQPPKRVPDATKNGLRYRLYTSDSASAKGQQVQQLNWGQTTSAVVKDPKKVMFYHVVVVDKYGNESPATVIGVGVQKEEVGAGKSPQILEGASSRLGYPWQKRDAQHADGYALSEYDFTGGSSEQTASYVRFRQGPVLTPGLGKTNHYLDLRVISIPNKSDAEERWKGFREAQGAKATSYRGYEAVEARREYTGYPGRYSVDPTGQALWTRMGLQNLETTVRLTVRVGPYLFNAEERTQCESQKDGPQCEKKAIQIPSKELDALLDSALALQAIEKG